MPKYDPWMKSDGWLKVIRGLPCFWCGKCDRIDAHHVGSRGTSLKEPDCNVIPLCHDHHMSHHDKGVPSLDWCRKALAMLHASVIEAVIDEFPIDVLDGEGGHLMRALRDCGGKVPML